MKVFDIMKRRNLWFGISITIIIVGLLFMAIKGVNLGIDFTGGTTIQANIGKSFEVSEIRVITDKYDKESIITFAGQDKDIALVKTKITLDVNQQSDLMKEFRDKFNIEQSKIQFESIGPTIGGELTRQALFALLLANIGILIYVSFRFEWKFGVAAIIALAHDVLIMLVVYSIAQISINASFIAAILTIVGYSINDTIVVFDRIRENKKRLKKIDHAALVNQSISETLSRSINTALTTLITIVALYILGVPAIKDFALPLIVGLLAGTYSSIFIASPLWAILDKKPKVAH